MNVEIRRGKGIEGLVRSSQVEDAKEIEASPVLTEVYERYVKILDENISIACVPAETLTDILTPEQINAFLQTTIIHENHQIYSGTTGLFISKLIQNSYDHGHNGFTLNTTALKEIHFIGYRVEGTPKKNIEVTMIGTMGDFCGYESGNSTFNIQGNTGKRCGSGSKKSVFNLKGSTGDYCGEQSQSIYNIDGNTGTFCGSQAEGATFTIHGIPGDYCGDRSVHSTYKTKNKEALRKMLRDVKISVRDEPTGDKIIFIHPDGTEEVKRDY